MFAVGGAVAADDAGAEAEAGLGLCAACAAKAFRTTLGVLTITSEVGKGAVDSVPDGR